MIKQERIEKAVSLMHEHGFDGLLYATGANFQYLTNTGDIFWQRCCMTNLFGHYENFRTVPEAVLLVNKDRTVTVFTTYTKQNDYPELPNVVCSYMDQFEDAMAPYITGKHYGVGFGCKKYIEDTLKEINKEITFTDAEDLLKDIRCIKDADEIAIMREMAKFTDDAVMYVVKNLKEGMTMAEAENLLVNYGYEHNIPDFSFPPTVGFKTKDTITSENVEYYDRNWKLQPNTGIAFDVGYMNHGYCSDWGRTVYYGKAPEKIRKAYEALQAGQVFMCESIVPYKTNVNELYKLVKQKVTELGFGDDLRFPDSEMLGHQIGIDCHEFPMVNKDYDFVLKPGMIFCSEPKMWFEGDCYMRVEDMILITETGAEFLTTFPRDLFEI